MHSPRAHAKCGRSVFHGRASRLNHRCMPFDFINLANVSVSGTLTGIVYGLMALGLSVIFGVARVVNFAHGEMMALAMYAAVILFSRFRVNPLLAVLPLGA